jgi:hypothetical protein
MLKIDTEIGTLDGTGNFVPGMGGAITANKVDTKQKTWAQDVTPTVVGKGQSTWCRASLWEVNGKTMKQQVAANTVVKYTAPP